MSYGLWKVGTYDPAELVILDEESVVTMVGDNGVELRTLLAEAPESLNGLTGYEVGEETVAVNGNKVEAIRVSSFSLSAAWIVDVRKVITR